MKKIFIMFLCLGITTTCLSCKKDDTAKEISDALSVDVSKGSVEYENDTHGGFHGDGKTFVIINFNDDTAEAIIQEIASCEKWNSLPLTENLTAVLYGISDEYKSIGPYATDENGDKLFPEIKNGYYCFIDRYSGVKEPYSDKELFGRYSFNFTLAVYDTDADKLYYFEFDT